MIHELDDLPFEIHGANPLMIIPPREARSANESRKNGEEKRTQSCTGPKTLSRRHSLAVIGVTCDA